MTSSDRRLARAAMLAVTATFTLLTLAACGGGGGGGGPTATTPTLDVALTNSVTAANVTTKIAEAAVAQPAPGSVTQSSNVDSSNITTDQVEITAQHGSGGPSFSVRNGTAWSIATSDGNPSRISDTSSPWQGAELSKRIGSKVLYVAAYTDIEAPSQVTTGGTYALTFTTVNVGGRYTNQNSNVTLPAALNGVNGTASCNGCSFVYTTGQLQMTAGSMTFTPSDSSAATTLTAGTATNTVTDADYLAGGIWLIAPNDPASAADYEFGAFADGSDPFVQRNLAAVTGTAIYIGDAVGVYSLTGAGDTSVGYLEADVRLNANFGDANGLGTIDGSITRFVVDDYPEDGTLILGAASIGAQNAGFFQGSVSDDGASDSRSFTGQWGGQFFGNGESDGKPGSVAGTFGAHSTDFTDVVGGGELSIVGAFGAHK